MFSICLFCVLLSIVSAKATFTDPGQYPPLLALSTSDQCILNVVTLAPAICNSNWTCACRQDWGPPLTSSVSQNCGTRILTDVPLAVTLFADFCDQLLNITITSVAVSTFPITPTSSTTLNTLSATSTEGTSNGSSTQNTLSGAASTVTQGISSGSITQNTSSGVNTSNNTQTATTASASSAHSAGLTPSQKAGVGVGIGLGVPVLLAAAIGVWFVQGAKKKKPRVERVEQQMGEPIHLGRM